MTTSDTTQALELLCQEPRLADLVGRYFDHDGPFAGHTFDTLGTNPSDRITESDLLAVSLLDVTYGPEAVRAILEAPEPWSTMLAAIDDTMPLWRVDPSNYDAADKLWKALITLPGVGPTKAGKLLARKRPRLIPIYDDVIGTFLRPGPQGLWEDLGHALRDTALRTRVDALGDGLSRRPSTLRLVDVAVWMRCGNSTNARHARIDVGLSPDPLIW